MYQFQVLKNKKCEVCGFPTTDLVQDVTKHLNDDNSWEFYLEEEPHFFCKVHSRHSCLLCDEESFAKLNALRR